MIQFIHKKIMILKFTEQEIDNKENVVEIEDIVVYGETIEVLEGYFVLLGRALIDGEMYSDFQVEFTLEKSPEELNCLNIINSDWIEYDFVF